MTNGFLDDLPDLWGNEYPRRIRIVKRGSSHIKTHPPVYRFTDYPEARKKLTKALNDNGTRQKLQAAYNTPALRHSILANQAGQSVTS
ncbi:MAG TPA: hypothetical protein VMW72_10600 [Sedimentisphaerales bacterium]|nr:hypothetical protein [Sedimentisphaerales bacterium]